MVPRLAAAVLLATLLCGACADGLEQPRTLPADEDALRAALLTAEEVPGYGVVRLAGQDAPASAGCDLGLGPRGTNVRRGFAPSDADAGQASIVEAIEVSDPEHARAAIDSVARIETCSSAGAPGTEDGSRTYEEHDAPVFGDDSAAFTAEFHGGRIDVVSEVVLVRIGDTVVSLASLAPAGADPTLPPDLVERAVAKVEAAAH